MPTVPKYVRAKVIAEHFSLTEYGVFALARARTIPSYRLGARRVRFVLAEVEAALRKREPAATPAPAKSTVG